MESKKLKEKKKQKKKISLVIVFSVKIDVVRYISVISDAKGITLFFNKQII